MWTQWYSIAQNQYSKCSKSGTQNSATYSSSFKEVLKNGSVILVTHALSFPRAPTDTNKQQSLKDFGSSTALTAKLTEELSENLNAVEFFNAHLKHLLLDCKKFTDQNTKSQDIITSLSQV